MAKILVVDDELGIRDLLSEILNDEGHSVELAENAAQARAARQASRPDLVLLDIWMPDTDGVTLLKEWRATNLLNMPVIMMSGHATIDTAADATRMGAHTFLEKPITMQKLLKAVSSALIRIEPQTLSRPQTAQTQSDPKSQPAKTMPPLTMISAQNPLMANGQILTVESAMTGGQSLPEVMDLRPSSQQTFDLDKPLRSARDAFEKAYFEFHLAREEGSMTRVAEKTGLERTHLYRKLKQLGVDLARGRRSSH